MSDLLNKIITVPRSVVSRESRNDMLARLNLWQARRKAHSPLSDIDGSITVSTGGRRMVWFRLGLTPVYDLLKPAAKEAEYNSNIGLIESLVGRSCRLEVLAFPVSPQERYERFRAFELDPTNPVGDDPDWEARRHARVVDMVDECQELGDFESRAYLGIWLSQTNHLADPSLETFMQIDDESRFYLQEVENGWMVREAADLLRALRSALGPQRVRPVEPDELDVFLGLTNWPGQPQVYSPHRFLRQSGQRELAMAYYGQCSYRAATPGTLEFDYYGTKSYASFVPIVGLPDEGYYLADDGGEFGFLTTSQGRRIRLSWDFTVFPGSELKERARTKMRNAVSEAAFVQSQEGEVSELDRKRRVTELFFNYLDGDGLAVVGTPVVVFTGDSTEEVADERQRQISMLKHTAALYVDDRYQMDFYEHCRPGGTRLRNDFMQYLMPQTFARSMPLVTSLYSLDGPDLLGWVRGREGGPFTGSTDITALVPGINRAPVGLYVGPSGGGKTTALADGMLAYIERTDAVGFIFELNKQDVRNLLTEDYPHVDIRFWNLAGYPGLLNPAGLAEKPDQRLDLVAQFFQNVFLNLWEPAWKVGLRDTIRYVLREADEAGQSKPDLTRVIQLLEDGKLPDGNEIPHGREMGSHLGELLSDHVIAPVFLSAEGNLGLIDQMIQPGLNVIIQDDLKIPLTDEVSKYTMANRLALAGRDVASALPNKLAFDRSIRVAMSAVEFSQVSNLTSGASESITLGRVGRSLKVVGSYDSQLWDDIPENLIKQTTTWLGFQPEEDGEARNLLIKLGLPVTTANLLMVETMAKSGHAANKDNVGTHVRKLPNGEIALVQSRRYYVGTERSTDVVQPAPTSTK